MCKITSFFQLKKGVINQLILQGFLNSKKCPNHVSRETTNQNKLFLKTKTWGSNSSDKAFFKGTSGIAIFEWKVP